MEFRILGPVELRGQDGPLPVGGRRDRALLGLLLLAANQRVTTDELIEGLWGEAPPATAATALQGTVSRLRKLLARGGAARNVLATETGGYLLHVEREQLDLHRFERLAAEGRAALATGDAAGAATVLREALGLWRGPPLDDLRYESFAQSEIKRLDELRLAAFEDRIDADLALGRHAEVIAELELLVSEHPLRERLRGQLMLALYRSGRQADALASYQALRDDLVAELGIDPGRELRELHRRILNHDDSLAPRPPATRLPAGTVTLLAAAFDAPTRLVQEVRDRYAALVVDAQARMRAAADANEGIEVESVGESFLYAFGSARGALRTAAAAQRRFAEGGWPEEVDVRLRVGIHTGEPTVAGQRYVGIDVQRVGRICTAAHGRQTLVSAGTRQVVDDLPAGLDLRDVGEQRLEDGGPSERLYQLVVPGIGAEFPPPRALHPTNVPRPATPLVGRREALARLRELVLRDDVRLVTLTGVGGSGKSRLALELGAELLDDFRDGVFLVPLASIADRELVLPTVAHVLSVPEVPGEALAETLVRSLAAKDLLLVLDNFEQILPAARELTVLVERTQALKLVVTSRAALRISPEHRFAVPPLAVPELRREPSPESLAENEAATLFAQRAQAVDRSFAITRENAAAVAEISVRLDGLPLALELAAARVNLLSPAALLARLDDRFRVLTAGAHDRPRRQQTLRATLDWSHDLLADVDALLFRRLAIFAGGCTVEAAERVCDLEEAGGLHIVDALESLVEKSLVQRGEGARGEPRFSMLETVHEYARERLAAAGEADALASAHARSYLDLAQHAYERRLDDESEMGALLEREHDNLRAAAAWLARADPGRYVRLAGILAWFWNARSHIGEGRDRLAHALELEAACTPADRARCLVGSALLETWRGEIKAATAHLEEARATWEQLGDRLETAVTLDALAYARLLAGDLARARAEAAWNVEEALALGRPELACRGRLMVALVAVAEGDADSAEPLARDALADAIERVDLRREMEARHVLGDCALIRGDCEEAERRYAATIRSARRCGDLAQAAVDLEGVAMAAAGRGDTERAVWLAGAASAAFDRFAADMDAVEFWASFRNLFLDPAKAALGPRARAVWEEGRRLPLETALDAATSATERRTRRAQ